MRITSTVNAQYRHWRRLADAPRACRESGRTLAEGIHLVEAAVAARASLQAIVLSEAAGPEARALGEAVAAQTGCRRVELPARLYKTIAPVEHGAGLLAEIEIVVRDLPRAIEVDAIFLDGVQDPGNAGTLLRTAAAAGVRHVVASSGTAFLWAPKVLRAAMGAHFTLSIYEDVPPEQLAAAFSGERLAADPTGDESLFAAQWGAGPTVWLFGSEGSGLSAAAHAVAQRRLHIPVASGVESLNVAAAAAICLFEQRRRRA